MTYQLIIFDFDGTLANTLPWAIKLSDQVADRFNLPRIEQNKFEDIRKMDMGQMAKHYGVPLWKLPKMGMYFQQLLYEKIDQVQLFDGIEELIDELYSMDKLLAVVSSNSIKNVKTALGTAIVKKIHYFEGGVRLQGKSTKFRHILKLSSVPNEQCISIGDEIRDIKAAKKVKIPCAAVSWGFSDTSILEEHQPDYIFSSVSELRNVLIQPAGNR